MHLKVYVINVIGSSIKLQITGFTAGLLLRHGLHLYAVIYSMDHKWCINQIIDMTSKNLKRQFWPSNPAIFTKHQLYHDLLGQFSYIMLKQFLGNWKCNFSDKRQIRCHGWRPGEQLICKIITFWICNFISVVFF